MEYTIDENNVGARLDQFLTEQTNAPSRAFVQRNIKAGHASINGTDKTPHYALRLGDVVRYDPVDEEPPALKPDSSIPIKTVAQTDEYLVIEKPSGLTVHPATGATGATLADGLVAAYPDLADVGEDTLRPGIVHRLDRDVSGLMVIAKTQTMFENLKKQFQAHTVHKEYTALVYGQPPKNEDTITIPIGRSKTKGNRMAAHTQSYENDRDAHTSYVVMEKPSRYSLLKVTIATGRTHQIRVHLRAIGCPIVGDQLYSIKSIKPAPLPRIFLHATKLSFETLGGEHVTYESPLPKQLTQFLDSVS